MASAAAPMASSASWLKVDSAAVKKTSRPLRASVRSAACGLVTVRSIWPGSHSHADPSAARAASACSRVSTRSEWRHDLPRAEEGSVTSGMIRTSTTRHQRRVKQPGGRAKRGAAVGGGTGVGWGGARRTLDTHRLETPCNGGVVLAQVGCGEVRMQEGRRAPIWGGDFAEEGHHLMDAV